MSQRESKAFEILMRENTRMLLAYLHGIIRDKSSVDDLFQETMIVAWQRLDDCDLSLPFGPWLRGIASRLVMAYYRKKSALPVFLNDAATFAFLSGKRKSKDVRGPKEVDVWFEPETGLVRQMFLDGLPRRGGGPRSVLVELVGQENLGPDFFQHESHHDPDRKIKYEAQK